MSGGNTVLLHLFILVVLLSKKRETFSRNLPRHGEIMLEDFKCDTVPVSLTVARDQTTTEKNK